MVIIDGIRYATEMANISYCRLADLLQSISGSNDQPGVHLIAMAQLDAWSIVDSVHRFRDLLQSLPGLSQKEDWFKSFLAKTGQVNKLRNYIQHQTSRQIDELVAGGGQLWGYISWVHLIDGKPTDRWLMLSGGTHFKGDSWLYIGPIKLPFVVPPNRIRLNAFGEQVYLWRIVAATVVASRKLESLIENQKIRLIGSQSDERRGADAVFEGSIEVISSIVSVTAPEGPAT